VVPTVNLSKIHSDEKSGQVPRGCKLLPATRKKLLYQLLMFRQEQF
jgi:hypothetical protein